MPRLLLGFLLSLSIAFPCWAGASRDADGTGDYLTFSGSAVSLNVGTVAYWMNSDIAFNGNSFYFFDTDTARHAFFHCKVVDCNENNVEIYNDGRSTDFNGAWNAGEWHFHAFVYNKTGNVQTYYLDGVSQSSIRTSGTWGANSVGTNAYIGSRFSATQQMDGRLCYFHHYNKALTVVEVNEIMRHPGSIADGLIVFLPILGTASPENDLSGNGTTGTINGNLNSHADGPPVFLMSPMAKLIEWLKRFLDPVVWADDIILCNPTDSLVPGRVSSYQRSADPFKSGAITNPNSLIWSLPTSTVRPWDGVAPPGSSTYWKCVDTDADVVLDDVVEMSQAEKDAVDAPGLAAQAIQTAYDVEIAGSDLCTATLAELTTRVNAFRDTTNADIAAAGNVAQLKTVLTAMNTTYTTALKKMARCTRARAR